MERKELAAGYKTGGYNCTQAILKAFQPELGMDEETLMKLGTGFGVGMGTMEGTCGALLGTQIVLGMAKPGFTLRDAKQAAKAFAEKAGAYACKDIKGRDTGVVLCSCEDCVRRAVEIAEAQLASEEQIKAGR